MGSNSREPYLKKEISQYVMSCILYIYNIYTLIYIYIYIYVGCNIYNICTCKVYETSVGFI